MRAGIVIDAYEFILDKIFIIDPYNTFPTAWKTSIVVPIPKVNNPKFASELRPISLIPLPGKILEHLASVRLKNFIKSNNIPNQHGFREGHSIVISITTLLQNIFSNVNNQVDAFLVYLDLKKAFDTVSHPILLNKLGNLGLDNKSGRWFRDYVDDRYQYVKFNNVNSSMLPTKYGVPQGSIFGPTLFALYINDLAAKFNHENILLYANDTVLFGSDAKILQENVD